jgi:site-specific DNA recombinase
MGERMPGIDLQLVRAATYSRVSTQQQAQEGFNLAEYVRLTAEYVRDRDWLLVGEYIDAGVSGRRNDRLRWNELLAGCRAGSIDAVVVHALSRFSRSAGDAIQRINELRDLGIDFISLKEAFDSRTANGRAMLGMTAVFAQLEAEQTAERSTLAQRAKARQGLWPGGPAPYGWRLEGEGRDAYLVPDSVEREVLRIAVDHILADNGTTGSAAALLNSLGHVGRKGGPWTHQRVLRTLTSPALKGEAAWAKPTRPYGHQTRLDPRTGEPLWGPTVELTLANAPLDDETYDRLQRALSHRRYGFKRPARPYPLSGFLCPAGDDHTMGGVASRERRSYRCKHARWSAGSSHERCPMPRVDAVWAERTVADQIWMLTDPLEVMAAASRHIRSLADATDAAQAARDLASTENALRRGREGLRAALSAAIRAGAPEQDVEAVVGQAKAELAALQARVQQLIAAAEAVPPDLEWAEAMARAVTKIATKLHDSDADPAAFGSVISALGVRIRALEYSNHPCVEVTATVTRSGLHDLLVHSGECLPVTSPARRSLTLTVC